MAKAKEWTRRVAAWRESGLKSEEFCAGREFSAGLMRHWAWRLGKTRRRRGSLGPLGSKSVPVRLARVVRMPSTRDTGGTAVTPTGRSAVAATLHIEVGCARIAVGAGFDGAILSAVLDVLERRVVPRGAPQ
jgi:hypothetical protein